MSCEPAPATVRRAFAFTPVGFAVPMPTLPFPNTVKSDALVVLAMLNSGIEPLCCAALEMASAPHGVVVPIPTLPEKLAAAAVSVPVSVGDAAATSVPPVPVTAVYCVPAILKTLPEAPVSKVVPRSVPAQSVVEVNSVEVALVKVSLPVKVLLSMRSVEEAELPPPPPVIQVPLIEKQPLVRLRPW